VAPTSFTLHDESSSSYKLIIMLVRDPFLCIIYTSTVSEYIKFATYNLKFRIVFPPLASYFEYGSVCQCCYGTRGLMCVNHERWPLDPILSDFSLFKIIQYILISVFDALVSRAVSSL
jgi:hypothetical protein